MHQSTSKKNKIIIYLILLFILSTTSGKFAITQNSYLSIDNKISVEGLSNTENFNISNDTDKLTLISGPCLLENEKIAYKIASKLAFLSKKYKCNLIFKCLVI